MTKIGCTSSLPVCYLVSLHLKCQMKNFSEFQRIYQSTGYCFEVRFGLVTFSTVSNEETSFCFVPLIFCCWQNIKIGTPRKVDKINELHIVCIEAKQNQITHKYSNYWKHEHLPNLETLKLQDSRTSLFEENDKLYFLPTNTLTHQIVKIHNLSIETAVVEIASKKCCIVLF